MGRYFDSDATPEDRNRPRAAAPKRPDWAAGVEMTPAAAGAVVGRAGRDARWVKALAQQHTVEAIQCLLELVRDCDDPRVRHAAAVSLLDRGWGRPAQSVSMDHTHRIVPAEELHARVVAITSGQPALPAGGRAAGGSGEDDPGAAGGTG